MFWQALIDDFMSRMQIHAVPVRIQLWNGHAVDLAPEPPVVIRVNSLKGLRHVAHASLDSLGQAYVEGHIDLEGKLLDLIDVAAQLARHSGHAERADNDAPHAHSRELDRDAIQYHYDVSNAFYAQWLDPEMVYSCAYFHTRDDTLEAAQLQKIDHILTKIRLQPGQTLLDIGCGWGALAIRAAKHYGARVLGVTLSENQYEFAQDRIRREGLADRCEVRLLDYRDVTGQFDRITSVGMFEHVGLANLETYFRCVNERLADGGVVMNHGITSTDPHSRASPWGGGDFIDRYVFPHGELPHIGLVLQTMSAAGLEATDVENLRHHYALTLHHWAERFEASRDTIRTLAGEERYRIWRVYLAGCAHAFTHEWVALHQVVGIKGQGARPGYPLPLTRDYIYVH
ncbi:cyclopropane-fatty-acyl-phospholipid synthase family protein [Chitiniphilus shinanonensis]|uniref:cyclopropane-fatty-acyl-phospholipid synthase family protein n=1 Tax=Chitiniphilus shinanonensis TaxID=553088 RepID=UPI003049C16F